MFDKSSKDTRQALGYRVYRHDPLRQGAWYLILVVIAAFSTYYAFRMGERHGMQNGLQVTGVKPLQDQIDNFKTETSDQRAEVERLKRTSELDRKAAAEVSRNLSDMEAKMLELNEELSFYKTVVGPSKLDPSLHVQDFRVAPGGSDREYSYRLILTQTRGDTRTASGEVDLVVEGRQGIKSALLPLKEIAASGGGSITFSFKFFQSVSGDFVLPAGFKPTSVRLRVKPSDDGFKGSERAYRWNDITVGGV